ncbi:sigma factor-like helix-turn-helix DNA-binding protein [Vibrio coralliirubri]|uniref:sigma factor-like helix-turn-helix DNA-binding protein n=1 Tax=Vibrio coralliirubri TaxID=1516159 RepID=UPI000A39D041|nr:sigma factor-like helix-turn-helix DNA-binding protein [Vibrio coralliirubri]
MSVLKLYFCTFYDDEPTKISVHRDLNTVLDEWNECDKSTSVGLIHVGFVRPKVLKIPQILKFKGKVLCTSSAKWALPLEYTCSRTVVLELSVSGMNVPIHLAMQGFCYSADEPGGMTAFSDSFQKTASNKLTIVDAALKVLEKAGSPLNKEEIFANIVEEGLYQFGDDKPLSAVEVELNRYCLDAEYCDVALDPIFGKAPDGKFFLLQNTAHELDDWLVLLDKDDPKLLASINPYGICSEQSYLKSVNSLPRVTRDKLEIYRYHTLRTSGDIGDPEYLLSILPESLRQVDLSVLGLTVRLMNVFNLQSIRCLADLDGISLSTMMSWPNFGRKSAKDLCEIISSNFDTLMERVSVVPLEITEAKEVDCEQPSEQEESDLIGMISQISLKNHFEKALSQLKERDREVIELRTGCNGKVMTLEEVGQRLNVTRERVRQLQKKYVTKIMEREYWDDCIAIKIGQLLIDRESPLYLEMLELEDSWFAGFMGNYANLTAIIELFSEAEIRIIKVNGANIVTRIRQDDWDKGLIQFRKSLKDKAEEGGWTRSDINMTFKAFLAETGSEELLTLLWDQFSSTLQFSSELNDAKLIGFGRSAEAAVSAVLTQAEKPLHYSEIAERAAVILGRPVNERLAHNAVPRLGGKLFGRGVYGLSHFNPISERMCQNLRLVVSKIIYDGPIMKQWHCGEIITQLKSQFPGLPSELDHYILNMILEDEDNLTYLNRMVWARSDSNQSKDDRVDMADAFTKILEDSGGPLKGSEIKVRLQEIRGVTESLQIQPTDRMILVGPDYWGLVDRDVPGSAEENLARLDVIYNYLRSSQKGIHHTEVEDVLRTEKIPGDAPQPYTLFNLAQRDERFYLARAMFLGLAEWGEDVRRLNFSQAVRKIVQDMTRPLSIAEINAKVESLTGLEVDSTVTGLLINEGGKFDPSIKLWWK